MKHTELPWRLQTGDSEKVVDRNGIGLAVMSGMHRSGEQRRANADFIVRACNAHDELMEAASRFVNDFYDYINSDDCDLPDPSELEAVIVKAKGPSSRKPKEEPHEC